MSFPYKDHPGKFSASMLIPLIRLNLIKQSRVSIIHDGQSGNSKNQDGESEFLNAIEYCLPVSNSYDHNVCDASDGELNNLFQEYIDDEDSVEACTFDPTTGQPTCS